MLRVQLPCVVIRPFASPTRKMNNLNRPRARDPFGLRSLRGRAKIASREEKRRQGKEGAVSSRDAVFMRAGVFRPLHYP